MQVDQRGLYLEYQSALRRVRGAAADWLRQFTDVWAFEAVGSFGLSRVVDAGDGRYEPVESGGQAAILFPCWDHIGPAAPYLGPEFFDLAAWLPTTGQTLRRTGLGSMMGADSVDYGDELRMFSSPIAWANASGQLLYRRFAEWEDACQPAGTPVPPDMAPFVTNPAPSAPLTLEFIPPPTAGVVILDWESELLRLQLWGPRRFVVDDIETGRRLRAVLLGPKVETPEILVSSAAVEGVAA